MKRASWLILPLLSAVLLAAPALAESWRVRNARYVMGTVAVADSAAKRITVELGLGKTTKVVYDDETQMEGDPLEVGATVHVRLTNKGGTRIATKIETKAPEDKSGS